MRGRYEWLIQGLTRFGRWFFNTSVDWSPHDADSSGRAPPGHALKGLQASEPAFHADATPRSWTHDRSPTNPDKETR